MVIVLVSIVPSSSAIDESQGEFLALSCVADATVGLHDVLEEQSPIETYEARSFKPSRFTISENLTFRDLLDDEGVDLYLSLSTATSTDVHEYTCTKVIGFGKRTGFSCTNTPPTEILTLDTTSLRFARASVGAWTLYSASDSGKSATLFVEKGTCHVEDKEKNDEEGPKTPP